MAKEWRIEINLENELNFDEYKFSRYFDLVANVLLDTEKTKEGKKKRQTTIKFEPTISKERWKEKSQYCYIFTMNDKIIKIGGTRDGLHNRTTSYLCGYYTKENRKSGKCSVTNARIYNTFEYYLKKGKKIKMYAYHILNTMTTIKVFDEDINVDAQVYQAYETKCLEEYRKQTDRFPILSLNCDPKYKTKKSRKQTRKSTRKQTRKKSSRKHYRKVS